MGLFFWKDNRKIDAFAVAVADDLFSHVRPEDAAKHLIINQMRTFRDTNNLGVYGKARLQMKFNERLIELGYDVDDTNRLVDIILTRLP
jgi:hypothetical protein